MDPIAAWHVDRLGSEKVITLLQGDLSVPPPDIDVLIVSAFPNDYAATPRSLIGALARAGISVWHLSKDKELDLRSEFSFWLSKPVTVSGRPFRVLCLESGWRGSPPEIADDVFRALATSTLDDVKKAVVAMPIIGAGDQGFSIEQMLPVIMESAAGWLRRGLRVSEIRIVVRPDKAERAVPVFEATFEKGRALAAGRRSLRPHEQGCDVFLSYSHKDEALARAALDAIKAVKPDANVFFDRSTLAAGDSWLLKIAESLDDAKRVLALYTPDYWSSTWCQDEFVAAFTRQRETGESLLFPVHLKTVNVPYLFRSLQYTDCREADATKLVDAARRLAMQLA